jgi:type IV pilus modification protein PilV
MSAAARRIVSRCRDAEDGMTLVEVLVAAIVLVVGILSMATVLTNSASLTTTSEREAQALDFAQQQLEQLRALPYASVAQTSCTGDAMWTRLKTSTDPLYVDPLATEAAAPCAGRIAPVAPWQDDRMAVRGSAYRYVTQPSANVRRIVVAVTADGAGALRRPVVVSGLKTDPDAGMSENTLIRGTGSPCPLASAPNAASGVIGLVCSP